MYSFLQQSIRDGSLVLWHDYRRWNQTFLDLSGQGNDGVASGAVTWEGGGIKFGSTGVLTVADAPELKLTAGTLVSLGDFTNLDNTAPGRLIGKRSGADVNYEMRIDGSPIEVSFYDGVAVSTQATDYRGRNSIACSFSNGAPTPWYFNGVLVGTPAQVSTVTVNATAVYIGNALGAGNNILNALWAALIFNRALTATEHATIFGELMALPGGEH
jgi:hypothetical protein